MPKIFVKPSNADFKIKDPETGLVLPAEGAEVADSQFWLRRVRNGDVTMGEPAKLEMKVEPETVAPKEPASTLKKLFRTGAE